MGVRGWYSFLHDGRYYCFYRHWCDELGDDLVRVLQQGGPELLCKLRKVFDFVAAGTTIESPSNDEWQRAFAEACSYLNADSFESFNGLEMVDLSDTQG